MLWTKNENDRENEFSKFCKRVSFPYARIIIALDQYFRFSVVAQAEQQSLES